MTSAFRWVKFVLNAFATKPEKGKAMRMTAINIKASGDDTTEFDVTPSDFSDTEYVWAAAKDAMFEAFGHMNVTCWTQTYGEGHAE